MDPVNDFKLLNNLDWYDAILNPKGLSIYELLPYGVEWECNGIAYKLENENKIIPRLLKSNDQIALIKSPFDKKENQALIITSFNEVKWNVSTMIREKNKNAIFTDVCYVFDELFFFVNINNCDYRFSFDPKNGRAGDLIVSY
ncbi:hypothetical protein ACQ3G4_16715 [bacterium BS0013]